MREPAIFPFSNAAMKLTVIRWWRYIFPIIVITMLQKEVEGNLNRVEKQTILDFHNYQRAVHKRNQIQWSEELSMEAQSTASKCDPEDAHGQNFYYNTTVVLGRLEVVFSSENYVSSILQPIEYSRTMEMGCGQERCPKLFQNNGLSILNTNYYVCKFSPIYYETSEIIPMESCPLEACPQIAPNCVLFSSSILEVTEELNYCASSTVPPTVPPDEPQPNVDRVVTNVLPRRGSIAGGTRLRITGRGFSSDMYNGANVVSLTRGSLEVGCDIETHRTSTKVITCVTRSAVGLDTDSAFTVSVKSSDGNSPLQPATVCPWCTFTYNSGHTPYLQELDPPAITCGETIRLSGKLFATTFSDPDTLNETQLDAFTRILTGGSLCSPTNENGTMFGVTSDDRGLFTSVKCLPMCRVASMNVTAILARRGNSFVREEDYVCSVDNNLQPYCLQMHADIQSVFPSRGSVAGGTRLYITINPNNTYNSSDIKVVVGGVPCIDVYTNSSEDGQIQCTTRPSSSNATQYPGHRGVLVEVFKELKSFTNLLLESSPSPIQFVHESLHFHHGNMPSLGITSQRFSLRITGYFVPPRTSFYTFNVLSVNGECRLYFVNDTYGRKLMASSPPRRHHGWDQSESQISHPVLLQEATPYQIEIPVRVYYRPIWFVGVGVKLHNVPYTSHPYVADRERQNITITSRVVKEKQMVNLEAMPQVQELRVFMLDDQQLNLQYSLTFNNCFPFNISIFVDENKLASLPVTLRMTASEMEKAINNLEVIQNVGKMVVKRKTFGRTKFILLSRMNRSAISLPILRLESEVIGINCFDSTTSSNFSVMATLIKTQNFTVADGFSIGYNDTQSPRFTPVLLPDITQAKFEEEMNQLLKWVCDYPTPSASLSVLYSNSFEGNHSDADNSTAFCGGQSKKNPGLVWQDSAGLRNNHFVCFAFQGVLPKMKLGIRYPGFIPQGADGRIIQEDINATFVINTANLNNPEGSSWSKYSCLMVTSGLDLDSFQLTQLRNAHSECLQRTCSYGTAIFNRIEFESSENFRIDELYIARQNMTITRLSAPITSNGVEISYIAVEGGQLLEPILIDNSNMSSTDIDEFQQENYTMVTSTYMVTFTVLNCGYGMDLLQGYYNNTKIKLGTRRPVSVVQIDSASKPVEGNFSIKLEGKTLSSLPAGISAEGFQFRLDYNYPNEGGFQVNRSGSCDGFSWEIDWKTRGGDVPQLEADGTNLMGIDVNITTTTTRNGGLWLRPLRGDMLRTIGNKSQVDVIVSGIPSSCSSGSCSFEFDSEMTPTLLSISPAEGQEGTTVMINGTQFSYNGGQVAVFIGSAPCNVTKISSSSVSCIVSGHAAGSYRVRVLVEGIGFASGEICFLYNLHLDSIAPSDGNVAGGYEIAVTGKGFPELFKVYIKELPWIHNGIGLPVISTSSEWYFCPSQDSDFDNLFQNFTYDGQGVPLARSEREERFRNMVISRIKENNAICKQEGRKLSTKQAKNELCDWNIGSAIALARSNLNIVPLSVLIGGYPCIISRSSNTNLSCTILLAPPGHSNVTVSVFSQTAVLERLFMAGTEFSPTIASRSPEFSPVSGGGHLSIFGFGLSDQNSDSSNFQPKVFIGSEHCRVEFANDTHILCIPGPHGPGSFHMQILTPDGIAITENGAIELMDLSDDLDYLAQSNWTMNESLFPIHEYKLTANITTLVQGSVAGGAAVVIEGGVFVEGQTRVFIGGSIAHISSLTQNKLVLLTPSSKKYVHIEFQVMFIDTDQTLLSWNQTETAIQVGDTVTWTWKMNQPSPVRVALYLTGPPESNYTRLNDTNFGNGDITANSLSTYSFTFTTPGVYHYAAVSNMDMFQVLHDKIIVTNLQSSLRKVEIYVNNFLASPNAVNECDNSKSFMNQDKIVELSNCSDDSILTPPINSLYVLYSSCNTPVFYTISPQQGFLSDTVFTIYGRRFSTISENNVVTVGLLSCLVSSSTYESINCTIEINETMKIFPIAWTEYALSVRVTKNNIGNAFKANENEDRIQILPKVSRISPDSGSLLGGTDVVISGSTFTFETEVSVGFPCKLTGINHNEIRCTTLPIDQDSDNVTYGVIICTMRKEKRLCTEDQGLSFTYSYEFTPNVTSIQLSYGNSSSLIVISLFGDKFSSIVEWNQINIGNHSCNISSSNQTSLICSVPSLPASTYEVSFIICNASSSRCLGYAQIHNDYKEITIQGFVTKVSPSSGSIHGGTELTLEGQGFHRGTYPLVLNVTIGNSVCQIQLISSATVRCTTRPHPVVNESPQGIQVTVDDVSFVSENITYSFLRDETPGVTTVVPRYGQLGDFINISGNFLSPVLEEVVVKIGGSECNVLPSFSTNTSIFCSLGVNFAGNHSIHVLVPPYGIASTAAGVMFDYRLRIFNLSVPEGSLAGGNAVTLYGAGFDPSSTHILICGIECQQTSRLSTVTQVECIIPPANTTTISDLVCDVELQSLGRSETLTSGYNYSADLTPSVSGINRTRGGTAGGSAVLITGQGFTDIATVTIAGTNCSVVQQSPSAIHCITGASSRTIRSRVMVHIANKGLAQTDIMFWYVDLWSSPFTWQNLTLPSSDDFVVVPTGQTLVLDIVTPILSLIVIQGGELIFDEEAEDNQVALHTQRLLIVSKGRLEIGTEDRPFQAKTEIVLYGHTRSTELPVFGTKNIALREGEILVHGRPINVTWTKLISTASAGGTELYLRDWVTWEVGGEIVIASTSFSQRENEVREIQSISSGARGSILVLTEPLEYEHISVQQVIAGRMIDTSAEVGYLTRNILIRGNRNEEWSESIQACDQEFRTGQFEVQTCFQGRFGSEESSDQFGGHIMIHAAVPSNNGVTAKLAYVEFTHFGQAFRLGRYPIHFHLSGNVSGSYVRGCGIHHTFNRAVTIHAVDYLLVENNVAYNILGHAYFFEDGNEQYNIVQDNLGVFVRASSSLLNVDITPATFWVVNPNNIIRRNAAAGGTHFGFWYRIPRNPTGPSFTPAMCPQKQRVLEFTDNSAHSFGWYGLWVFPDYLPTVSGKCSDSVHAPSYFNQLFSWRNDRGMESAHSGSIQVLNSIVLDNTLAGIEYTDINSIWGENGSLIANTLIVGHSDISNGEFCTESGIKTPASYYLTVSNVTFVNFDRQGCNAIRACSQCEPMQGGFETRYEKISFENVTNITQWMWEHEHIHHDLDGTLTLTGYPSLLIPTSNLLDTNECKPHPKSSMNMPGSICNGSVSFGRLGITNPMPTSLRFTDLNITNQFGTTKLLYLDERIIGGPGYMAIVEVNASSRSGHLLTWIDGESITNISYTALTSGVAESDYILLTQNYPASLDVFEVQGVGSPRNVSQLEELPSASTGDYVIYNNGTTLTYVIKGSQSATFNTYKCFYNDCMVPTSLTTSPPGPPERSNNSLRWSLNSSWPNNMVPQDGEDVTITDGVYMLFDVPSVRIQTLMITRATLEILDGDDRVIEANYIIIQGGRLVAGYANDPFRAGLRIILHGDNGSPELRVGSAPPIGGKSIAVFGELILIAPSQTSRTWTILSRTAKKGSSSITLAHSVDWLKGDHIIITSTAYDPYQSEVLVIMSISANGLVVEVNDSLKYTHIGNNDALGYFGAEVGLLSRSIIIENGNPDIAIKQSFGCRVLVSQSFPYQGSAVLRGVEFRGCGQLGFTDTFDPRFALVFLNLQLSSAVSNVTECSFHSGFNTAIGVINSNNILLEGNVIHGTVGPSMSLVRGSGLQVTHNLASLAQYIGLFQKSRRVNDPEWTANYDISTAAGSDLIFESNNAAGGAMACFHLDGEDCENSELVIRSNVGHSCLHGIHLGYADGRPLQCSRFQDFILHNCYHYGFFSYSPASIQIHNSVFINNKAAIYVSVIRPASLSHEVGTKSVSIENTVIISKLNSTTRCQNNDSSSAVPPIVAYQSSAGILSPSGGHVGIIIPCFVSDRGHFPPAPWHSVISYPSINGSTSVTNVTFANFELHCNDDKRDVLFITNPSSEDANHPLYLRDITDTRSDNLKVYIHPPRIGRINPSDCVDMYCDGMKNVLLKDLDGSFTGRGTPHSIIPLAELGWDGADRRVGIGDYRIPVAMLTAPDGSRINIEDIYPLKGIVRGDTFASEDDCSFMTDWNAYLCSKLDHLMLVMESLDADTEVRRLSPVAYGANGFVNLVNGPMDNGWCGGYTCQERISTFYFLVAEGMNYTMALTSTNPQNMALHLLHASNNQAITVAMIYTNPQRLDVHVRDNGNDRYIVPTNAYMEDGNLKYQAGDSSQFIPSSREQTGSNFYDRDSKQLHITVRGEQAIIVVTTPVIMLSLTLSVRVNDFFDEASLIQNLALLLGIPNNRIRVVSVTRERSNRRKRQTSSTETVGTVIEIGDSPQINGTNSTANATDFATLSSTTNEVVNVVQGGLLNATVESFSLTMPQPPVIDPTGGVRATPETGGPQPDDVPANSTLQTFYSKQLMKEQQQRMENPVVETFRVPCQLVIMNLVSSGAVEGVPLSASIAPNISMANCDGSLSTKLGLDIPWTLSIIASKEPANGFLTNTSANFSEGFATFDYLTFSHPGSYLFYFSVSYPERTRISATSSNTMTVSARQLGLIITQQPQLGNITFPLYPYPTVNLVDTAKSNSLVSDHSWRNTTWYVEVKVAGRNEILLKVLLLNGIGTFTNLSVSPPGNYELEFSAYDLFGSSSSSQFGKIKIVSSSFSVINVPILRFLYTYNVSYQRVRNKQREFLMSFNKAFAAGYPKLEIINSSSFEGSIIVSVYVTARNRDSLVRALNGISQGRNPVISFIFDNVAFVPVKVESDPNIRLEGEENNKLRVALPVSLIMILICATAIGVLIPTLLYFYKRGGCNKVSPTMASSHSPQILRMVEMHGALPPSYSATVPEKKVTGAFYSNTPQALGQEGFIEVDLDGQDQKTKGKKGYSRMNERPPEKKEINHFWKVEDLHK